MGPLPRGGSRDGPAYPCAASQVYRGYVDDPRNTDNAWIETVAISIHFSDQSDMDLKRLNSVWAWAAGSRFGGGEMQASELWGSLGASRRGLPGLPGGRSWPRPESGGCREQRAPRGTGRGERAPAGGWMGTLGRDSLGEAGSHAFMGMMSPHLYQSHHP